MGDKKDTTQQGLTPEQQQAQALLLDAAKRGSSSYTGSFDVTPENLSALATSITDPNAPDTFGLRAFLADAMSTGFNVNKSADFTAQRKLTEDAAKTGVEKVLAAASTSGSKYGTSAAAAAAREAARATTAGEVAILQQVSANEQAAVQTRLNAASLASNLYTQSKALGLDAAKIQLAAKQYQSGMEYEEWKRNNPDTYSLLGMLWGRNVDQLVTQNPSWVGPALTAIGTIVGAWVGGAPGAMAGYQAGNAAGQRWG